MQIKLGKALANKNLIFFRKWKRTSATESSVWKQVAEEISSGRGSLRDSVVGRLRKPTQVRGLVIRHLSLTHELDRDLSGEWRRKHGRLMLTWHRPGTLMSNLPLSVPLLSLCTDRGLVCWGWIPCRKSLREVGFASIADRCVQSIQNLALPYFRERRRKSLTE